MLTVKIPLFNKKCITLHEYFLETISTFAKNSANVPDLLPFHFYFFIFLPSICTFDYFDLNSKIILIEEEEFPYLISHFAEYKKKAEISKNPDKLVVRGFKLLGFTIDSKLNFMKLVSETYCSNFVPLILFDLIFAFQSNPSPGPKILNTEEEF
ncbi:hypothetical protein BpHYR1_038945 [Brachionus plicatilis]|uniref:Uncharacterized protein n=1 Tax=Brachionus plicatilis TaxID=10195 RepID=A0A3M7PLI4_BRAPC|nr:hypothetical protein BpHYR1_038945 [Brachionus plicatilis]